MTSVPKLKSSYDAIVVGGGHNGMVGAHYLAKAGLSVLLVERREVLGGLLVTEEVEPGFRTNGVSNSSHNLESSIIKDMALEDHGLRFAALEPASFMMFPGGRKFVAGITRAKSFENIVALSSEADANGYFGALDEMAALASKLDVSFYDAPPRFSDIAARVQSDEDVALFNTLMFGSAADFIEPRMSSLEIQSLLSIVSISGNYLGPRTPGSAYMLFHRPLFRGSSASKSGENFQTLGAAKTGPVGGMGAIAAAMRSSIEATGIDVLTGCGVSEILVGEGRVTGVVTDEGDEFSAPIVLSAMNPQTTLTSLVAERHLPPPLLERIRSKDMEGSTFKLMLALDGEPRFACADSDEENHALQVAGFRLGGTIESMDRAYRESRTGQWSAEPVVWGLVPSAIDPTLAPTGKHVMSLTVFYAPLHLDSGSWAEEKHTFARHIIRYLDAHYIPGLEKLVLSYKAHSPQDLVDEFGLAGAHTSHGDISLAHMFDARPAVGVSHYSTPVAGLYLGSVGVWPGNYVSGLPGRNAANRVIRDRYAREPAVDESADASGAN